MDALPLKDGDIVVIDNEFPVNPERFGAGTFDFADFSEILYRPHNYGEVFADIFQHYNENGNRAIADALYSVLKSRRFYENKETGTEKSLPPFSHIPLYGIRENAAAGNREQYGPGLAAYKNGLISLREKTRGKTGAVVMNCNPFTLGHRYLAEKAASRVSHLYVFIVEEDKSFFPFEDRIELARAGIKDLKNVTVLPSGRFIISSTTFKEYFNKAEIQEREIDPSRDIAIFGGEIAPVLNITVRFAGEEPLDKITGQYNDAMRRVLPEYGIEFAEIPRKETGGEVISASRVRKLLDERDFKAIAKLVPKTTLDYLKKKYRRTVRPSDI
jgi:[citrate (pro-3S)-lyase] ligase